MVQEAYYLQPFGWIDSNNGDLDTGNISCEYLDFEFAIDATGKEYNGSDETHQPVLYNINEPINIKAKRDNIGECCLQVDGGNYFNKWTDLKRVQINTSAGQQEVKNSGYRVVETTKPAVWKDNDDNGAPNIWTEGWNDDYDTKMVQVKRHAEVDDYSWFIDCYMKDIDELYNIAENMSVSYANNQWIVSVTNNNQPKDYIFLIV